LCFAASALWFLGRQDQALNQVQKALTLARELSEPHGLANAFFFASLIHHLRGEALPTQECAEAAIAVSREHGLVMYQAEAQVTLGWALIEQGRHEGAIEQMRQGLVAHLATGAEVLSPHFFALLGEALGKTGEPEEGLRALNEGLAVAHRTGEGY